MNQKLFTEFPQVTKKDWSNQVSKDLKGKDFNETLVWQSLEGFAIQPYYAEEDLENLPVNAIQAAQKNDKSLVWQNRSEISYSNSKETNSLIVSALKEGVDVVEIDLEAAEISEQDLIKLLNNVKLSETPIYFKTPFCESLLTNLQKFVHYQPKGGFSNDILSNYFSGKSASITDSAWESTKKLLLQTSNYPAFRALAIESHVFHNAGANAVQELAYSLASAVTYLDKLTDLGLKIEHIIPKIEFSISIGTNYFIEIAKIRALRYLWSNILDSYNCSSSLKTCLVHAKTSTFFNSTLSPYTNMLRATTEAMSAAVGGCDSLTVMAYDEAFEEKENADLGKRIAKNVSILMKEEAHFDKTNDPSAGSYYIENLTFQLAKSAWDLFLQVENMGGILSSFEQGFIQESIEKSYKNQVNSLQNGKIMIGVNKFREELKDIQKSDNQGVIKGKYLKNRRLSEIFE